MLVLSRRPGERIVIGPGHRGRGARHGGRQVRLGVQAPRNVTVLRGELVTAVQAENRRAMVRPAAAALAHLRGQVAGRPWEPAPSPH